MRDCLDRLQAMVSGPLQTHRRVPVAAARRELHEHERLLLKAAEHVMHERGLHPLLDPNRMLDESRIAVPSKDIDVWRPLPIVERFVEPHHVRRDRDLGRFFPQRCRLGQEKLQRLVGDEPLPVKREAVDCRLAIRPSRHGDLFPFRVCMPPKSTPVGRVEAAEIAFIADLQPLDEGPMGVFAIVFPSVLV